MRRLLRLALGGNRLAHLFVFELSWLRLLETGGANVILAEGLLVRYD